MRPTPSSPSPSPGGARRPAERCPLPRAAGPCARAPDTAPPAPTAPRRRDAGAGPGRQAGAGVPAPLPPPGRGLGTGRAPPAGASPAGCRATAPPRAGCPATASRLRRAPARHGLFTEVADVSAQNEKGAGGGEGGRRAAAYWLGGVPRGWAVGGGT